MSHCLRPLTVAITLALACSAVQAKPAKPVAKPAEPAVSAEFELAHNLGAAGEERLQAIVDRFNKESGSALKLVRLEKGDKPAMLNLMRRYDMSDVLSQPKAFVPLHQMMAKAGQPLKFGELSGDLKAGVVDAKGKVVALPVLYSTPVLFYNKNAFRKAKLDPEQPPKTWFEMQGMLDKLQDAGYACPYTSSWPVWVHVDNVSAISGVPAATDKGQLTFNGLPQVKHLAMMATWSKANYFKLFGRRNEASAKFNEGECAMITTDSREHVDFRDAKGVELGVAPMPYHDDVYGGRQSSLADGASLWVGAGRTPVQYKQAAKFVNFMLSPEMQIEMVRVYGGLPMTSTARAAARSKLLQDGDKTLEIAYASLKGNGSKPAVRVANIDSVRLITNEEMEAVWEDKKPAKAALDTSVTRGNALLGAKPLLKKAQPF
ncbi:extracellular solute-binding protein [Ferribacterium limneticum]|uniref:extracellular solute-binding protein n=1 Tax=Ferribacterium limneticum TaxID=76259 RepID=UPI001CFB7655|nr:extracellular solute-binding protein [Ferribacterium limneticum]UCV20212.1 extracellular solute-binding protein [Ferribacterium limneticum]